MNAKLNDTELLSLTHSWQGDEEFIGQFKVSESDGVRWAIAPLPDGRFLCWGKRQENIIFDTLRQAFNHCM